MKKLILILAVGLYGLMLSFSIMWPVYVGCLNVEAYTIFVTFMVVPTFYQTVHKTFRYAVIAHLLVITSLIFPSVVHDIQEAKAIPYGNPFAFITQDHTESMAMADNLKFPFAEALVSPTDHLWGAYLHTQINYWAMLSSWLVVFVVLLTLRALFIKLFWSIAIKLETNNLFT